MTDRRYKAGNKYGNSRLYGASDVPIVVDRYQWGVDVGWNGLLNGNNEAQYMTGFSSFRGRRSFLGSNGQGFAPVETGRARITLDNSTGRYDAWNTASALYPNVSPGKPVRVRLRDLETGTIYPVFTGIVLDIEPSGYGKDAKVVLVCEDYWFYLRNSVVYYTFIQLNFTVREVIGSILNVIGNHVRNPYKWTYGTSLETSYDYVPYWWSSNSILMGEMLDEVAQSYFGKFFVANDGSAKYFDRTSTRTSVQTYTQSQMLKDIGNYQPWQNQRNVLKIRCHPRVKGANQIVWSLNTPLFIPAGKTIKVTSAFLYNGQKVPVSGIASNPGVDYQFNSQSDGLGTSLNNNLVINKIAYGDTVDTDFTNNGGTDGYLVEFDYVATPYYETGQLEIVYPSAVQPQNRELVIDSLWHQDIDTTILLVKTFGPQITTVRQFPVVSYDTRSESFVPDLFDVVNISIAKLGISATDFEVGGIQVETTSPTCQSFVVTHHLEPHFTSTPPPPPPPFLTKYLIVAAGGGGGGSTTGAEGGDAGAGGMLTGELGALTTGEVLTITVGAGGVGGVSGGGNGSVGGNSVLLSSMGTLTAFGGGLGGGGNSSAPGGNAGNGGSGGGGGGGTTNGLAGTGTVGQGNNGADAPGGGAGAGGGGKGGAAVAGTSGVGAANNITGAYVTYAAGGVSIGGNGTDGAANTGNGGAGQQQLGTGGTGGSGVVILRVLTTEYSGITTGAPTVTTDGLYTILKFTGSGTYTLS